MHDIALNELWTLVVALLTIGLGIGVIARVPLLGRYSIPPAVVGGFLVAVVLLVLQQSGLEVRLRHAHAQRAAAGVLHHARTERAAERVARRRRGGGADVAGHRLAGRSDRTQSVPASPGPSASRPRWPCFWAAPPSWGATAPPPPGPGRNWPPAPPNAFEVGMACATLGLVAGGVLGSVVATRLLARSAHGPGVGTAEAPVHGEVTLHGDQDDATVRALDLVRPLAAPTAGAEPDHRHCAGLAGLAGRPRDQHPALPGLPADGRGLHQPGRPAEARRRPGDGRPGGHGGAAPVPGDEPDEPGPGRGVPRGRADPQRRRAAMRS